MTAARALLLTLAGCELSGRAAALNKKLVQTQPQQSPVILREDRLSLGHAADLAEDGNCAPLRNRGTHFTIEIEVGTPAQKFDVVADTGSDNVIVASCICANRHRCSASDKCFEGGNRSSSFLLSSATSPSGQQSARAVVLTFGSGQIEAMIATDVVRVGREQATMQESLLLMVDRALSISGPFEGILGLGLPQASGDADSLLGRGFLERAGIARFSLCFNSGADGVLRLDTPAVPGALGSIGHFHWGLDFEGISVGDVTAPVQFCSRDSMKAGQQTPCGAIPDSGTTVMMAPEEHLRQLYGSLCMQWPRCKSQVESSDYAPYEAFQAVLLRCSDWLTERGLHELPPIHFHLAGPDGSRRALTLQGPAYVLGTREDEMRYVTKHLFGVFPVRLAVPTGQQKDVCLPAFASHQYDTLKNGPIWILGTPIFYEFQVGYDLRSQPPAISFSEGRCGECGRGPALVTSGDERALGSQRAARGLPRQVHGPWRIPKLNTSMPL